MAERLQNGPPPTRPQCREHSARSAIRCVLEEGHEPLSNGPYGVPLVHNFGGLGPYSPNLPASDALRYQIHGEGPLVVIVEPGYMNPQLDAVDLAEGWVWLSPQDGTFQAAHRDWLVPVLTDHDIRTISGGVTLRHGVMKDWVEQDQRWEIPTVDIELSRGGIVLRLRRADITEIAMVLRKMQAEMPPDPLMPG